MTKDPGDEKKWFSASMSMFLESLRRMFLARMLSKYHHKTNSNLGKHDNSARPIKVAGKP